MASLRSLFVLFAVASCSANATNAGDPPGTPPPSGSSGGPTTPAPPACGAEVRSLATLDGIALTLAQDKTSIYLSVRRKGGGHETITRVAKADGKVTKLAEDVVPGGQIQAIAADDAHVYWVAIATGPSDLGSVGRVPIAGGAPEDFATDRPINFYGEIAVGGGNVFWTEDLQNQSGRLAKKAINGGSVVTVKSSAEDRTPHAVAVGGGYVFWTTAGVNNQMVGYGQKLMRAPLAGGDAEIVDEAAMEHVLATNETSVFYPAGGKGVVRPFTTGAQTNIDVWGATALAASGDAAYAVMGQSELRRVPLDGTEPTTIGDRNDAKIMNVVVDEKCVYWLDFDKGLLTRER